MATSQQSAASVLPQVRSPLSDITASFAGDRKGSGQPPVCRCLFGPVDHDQNLADLKRLRASLERRNVERWNFDFESGFPVCSPDGAALKFDWVRVDSEQEGYVGKSETRVGGNAGGKTVGDVNGAIVSDCDTGCDLDNRERQPRNNNQKDDSKNKDSGNLIKDSRNKGSSDNNRPIFSCNKQATLETISELFVPGINFNFAWTDHDNRLTSPTRRHTIGGVVTSSTMYTLFSTPERVRRSDDDGLTGGGGRWGSPRTERKLPIQESRRLLAELAATGSGKGGVGGAGCEPKRIICEKRKRRSSSMLIGL